MKIDFNAQVLTNLAPMANKTRYHIPQKSVKKNRPPQKCDDLSSPLAQPKLQPMIVDVVI
ncbi:hypothetical protein [Lactiplantibacillus pentosus]|uniref:hypothetical protein n=1 Tax=Lactiplantibacillus pentosus TaxID=1589 RepID=UPI001ADDE14E|nr:hypothetical protein [Lactiplantibacillus pentosus]MBO9164256.1 hypothetical protein [Lactiplantibacillus pentosus]